MANDLGPSVPSQLLAQQLLPSYEDMAALRRRRLAATVERCLNRMADAFGDWTVETPAGSSAIWPELPVTDTLAVVALARRGVPVTPGSALVVGGGVDPHIQALRRPARHPRRRGPGSPGDGLAGPVGADRTLDRLIG